MMGTLVPGQSFLCSQHIVSLPHKGIALFLTMHLAFSPLQLQAVHYLVIHPCMRKTMPAGL